MAALLNQSTYILGVNSSFSDIFLILIIFIIVYRDKLYVPRVTVLFFLILIIFTLSTATVFTPIKYNVNYEFTSVISNFLKLLVVFLYLILGYNLSKMNYINIAIKWFSLAALIIGLIGISTSLLNISAFNNLLYFAGYRYQGFMTDPNYFSVLIVSALPFFMRGKKLSFASKFIIYLIILLSVFVAGSKTGTIVLLLYSVLILFDYFSSTTLTIKKDYLRKIIYLTILIIVLPLLVQLFFTFIDKIAEFIPIVKRITIIFTDFDQSINQEGSSREVVYLTALEIIKSSPIFGVGIGTYGEVAYTIAGHRGIAHNTYLQLAAEWGIPMTAIFFSYLLIILVKSSKRRQSSENTHLLLRDILIILLLGSLAISLNNARLFWFVFGALIYSTQVKKRKI